jgi:transcriptional regulator with XRE-family HTH domain
MPRKPTDVDIAIGKNILALRNRAGKSQKWLGDQLGVSFQLVQKIEKGRGRLAGSQIKKIADAFGVGVADVFEGTTARDCNIARVSAEIPLIRDQAIKLQDRLSAAIEALQGVSQ